MLEDGTSTQPKWSKATIQTVKAILRLYESDSVQGRYDTLVVLEDGAGITWGPEQTTENSGGIRKVLKMYEAAGGELRFLFEPYFKMLYGSQLVGKKFALTNNRRFKDLLVRAAKEDPLMRQMLDLFFEKEYLLPAITIADQYSLSLPLSLAVVYDTCIHSGPGDYLEKDEDGPSYGAGWHFWRFDENMEAYVQDCHDLTMASAGSLCDFGEEDEGDGVWTEKDWQEEEKRFIQGYIKYRLHWLQNHRRPAVQKTVYRMHAFQQMIEDDAWDLDLPLEVHRSRSGGRLKQPRLINTENIKSIPVIADELTDPAS